MTTLIGQTTGVAYRATVTLNYTSTAGNLLVLCVQHHGATVSPTITDTAGNAWQVAGDTTDGQGESIGTMYYCLDAGAVTSVTIPAQTSLVLANLSEWSGVAGFRSASSAFQATGATLQVETATNAGDLVIGHASVWSPDAAAPTPSAGWTPLDQAGSGSNRLASAYYAESAGGDLGPLFSLSGPGKFGNVTAAFIPATAELASASSLAVFRIAGGQLVPMVAALA